MGCGGWECWVIEVSGVVLQVGVGLKGFRPGDTVSKFYRSSSLTRFQTSCGCWLVGMCGCEGAPGGRGGGMCVSKYALTACRQ